MITDCLVPVEQIFIDTSFENLSLLLKSVSLTLSKFQEDHLFFKVLKPSKEMSREELRESQNQRSNRFGIEIAEGSSLTFPAGFPTELADYGDPVNLKFPFESEARAKNARVRFKQFANQIYSNSVSKNKVHERIIRRELDFDVNVTIDLGDTLDKALPTELRNRRGVTVIEANISKSSTVEKTWFVPIYKAENEERTAFGVVLEPDVTDLQGDTYDGSAVIKAAHNFMENFQNIGLMHDMFVNDEVNILESFVAPTDMTLESSSGPVTIRKNTWLMKVRILADNLWLQVKTGDLTGFSIGALANVEELTPRGATT